MEGELLDNWERDCCDIEEFKFLSERVYLEM